MNAAPEPPVPGALDLQDGPRAWSVVAAAFVAMFTSFGVAYSFGAFLLPMSAELGSGPGGTAAVFSLTTLAIFGLGALSGPAVDRFGPRRVVLVGALAMGLGLVLTSRATELWHAYLGHGLGVGLGVACSYVPLVAVVGGWFTRRRTLAVGITVSGIGLGTLLVAPLAADLIARHGWREAYLLLAAVSTIALVGCALFVRAAPVTTHDDPAPLLSRLRTPAYLRLYVSGLLLSIVLFIPFVHLPAYAASRGAGDVAAATLVGVIGAASIVGRLALGAAAARTGVLRTYQACFALMAGSFLLWLGAPGYPRLVVFAVLLGIGYGGFVALGPAVAASLFGVRGLGGLLGVLYTSAALGSALGPPAAGAVIGATGEHLPVVLAAVAIGAVATAVVLTVRAPAPVGSSS
ncbi:MFS transporter [Modestobacter sp. VKM Ac-2977]|uniref:MFS transporter n=1 Tax=Modestobacter sp. VKM Ac-2977 TaxID=3004131 RepID=UPI0022AB415A|nr:MFS transporter [Modestobacter sp. VKM Ac-2977]MCZ2820735.1 MFS transporter [Modestobacter sp. VKM Ac-2977]